MKVNKGWISESQNSVFEHFLFLKRQETSNKSECATIQHQDLYIEALADENDDEDRGPGGIFSESQCSSHDEHL